MMPLPTPLTPSADPRREIPAAAGARLDRIGTALESLAAEERRLARLGFELPMARCREQRRYWTFLDALFSLTDVSAGRGLPHDGERAR
jgi:hypothetical protein